MLVESFAARGVELAVVDDRRIYGDLAAWPEALTGCDVALLRSKSQWRNAVLAHWIESLGGRAVNSGQVLDVCGDKVRTTLALLTAGVPALSASVALTPEGGPAAAEEVGYPLVVKPVIGSWGRLIGKVNDADALDLAIDHKSALGGAPHAVTYLQAFVETGGQDIRSFVVADQCVAAITRRADGWKTNTALGAVAEGRTVDPELAAISVAAARAVGGGIVAVDLFETEGGYVVNEVNGTMEFRNSVHTSGIDIPGLVADAVLSALA
jgi:[lysine-biosynthesis-protein LysW]--L-2-aminoadipate ligase